MAWPWLHGTLHCPLFGAKDLVDETRISGKAPELFRKMVKRIEDKTKLGKGSSRLYVVIDFGKTTVGKTRIVEDDPVNPEWDESFIIYCCQRALHVGIGVKCDDGIGAHLIGRATVPAARILAEKVVEGSYHLIREGDNKKVGEIKVKLQFFGVQCDPCWGTGVGGAGDRGVPSTYFEQRPGCRITLYQDAHMLDGFLPQILMEGDQLYQAGRWWEDIFRAVANAKYLINIAGWSVKTEIKLVRDPTLSVAGREAVTLGELLKRKEDDGCKVLLLVWDDKTSPQNVPIRGFMNTNDQDTWSYFKHSNAECVLCPRIR